MAITTASSLPAPVQQSFDDRLLSTPQRNVIYSTAAQQKLMPARGGTIIRFRRANNLAIAPIPLGSTGQNPAPQALTAVDIDATVQMYGTFFLINEQVVLTSQDPVLNWGCQRLGYNLRLTEDTLIRDMLVSSAASINAVAGTNGDNPTEITRSDINDSVGVLMNADGAMILDNIEGEDKFATGPVRTSYFAMCHTNLQSDLQNVDGWLSKDNYPSPMRALPSEWGSAGNWRVLISTNGAQLAQKSNLGRTVYPITSVAMEGYAMIKQSNYSARFVYLPPEFSGGLAQNASLGWKMMSAYRILNEAWVLNTNVTKA